VHPDTQAYNAKLSPAHQAISALLCAEIAKALPDAQNKIWHRPPVWFLDGNPIVGYSLQKPGIRLMFWSGADFEEPGLDVIGKKFKDASAFFNEVEEIDVDALTRWLAKSREIQWDYKNIMKRNGQLERLV